jgi:hypothetical protein
VISSVKKIDASTASAGYEVLYHPFNGSYSVPEEFVPKGLDWFTASSPTES